MLKSFFLHLKFFFLCKKKWGNLHFWLAFICELKSITSRLNKKGLVNIFKLPITSKLNYQINQIVSFYISLIILAYSGRRRMGIPPFEPACRDESNGGRSTSLRPLDAKLIGETSSNRVFITFGTAPLKRFVE